MGRRRPAALLAFFGLVWALSVPFWLLGSVTAWQLLPGLPVSGLMFICPLIAASPLVYAERSTAGLVALLRRAVDHRRVTARVWYIPTLLLSPGVVVAAYVLMRWMEWPLPAEAHVPVAWGLALFPIFLVAAWGEELGWSGYAIDPMQDRWGALPAALALGGVWAAWHLVPLIQAHRAPGWMAGWCLGTVASRVLVVWLYNNTGRSVFIATLYHASSNVSWVLFPNQGSHYDPRISGPLLALTAGVVTVAWGPSTLARWRRASSGGAGA